MFKRLMYDKVIEVLNLNTQTVSTKRGRETALQFQGGYLLGVLPSGIPYAVIQTDTTTKYSYDNVEIIPVSEELSQETPSVNKSDRSDYVFRYQVMFRSEMKTVVENALEEFRTYFFENKQFELDDYTVAIKTTRADKLPNVAIDGGMFFNYYAFTVYLTAIKDGYIKKDTDYWRMAEDENFGLSTNAINLVVGRAYEITTLGTTNWNFVFANTDETYAVGSRGVCVNVGTGTGVAKRSYQDLTVITDTFATQGNPIFTLTEDKGKGFITTTTSNASLQIVYNGTVLEDLIYDWVMNDLDKDTVFKLQHIFNGNLYSYGECYISSASRTLTDNGAVLITFDWIEKD